MGRHRVDGQCLQGHPGQGTPLCGARPWLPPALQQQPCSACARPAGAEIHRSRLCQEAAPSADTHDVLWLGQETVCHLCRSLIDISVAQDCNIPLHVLALSHRIWDTTTYTRLDPSDATLFTTTQHLSSQT